MEASMWGTIVGGILGFLAAVLPKFFEIVQAYFTHQAEHQTQAQEIDAAVKGVSVSRMTAGAKVLVPVEGEVIAPGIPPETDDMLDAEQEPVVVEGPTFFGCFLNTLRHSVRPVVTYGFFVLFLFLKLKGFYHGILVDHTPVIQLLPVIWNEGTESLFAAVLAFWFGSRAFEKSQALLGKQEQVIP